jgi:hypothetical protein
VCSPVSNTLTKSGANWAVAARPGNLPVIGMARYGDDVATPWRTQRYEAVQHGLRLRELCPQQHLPSRYESLRMVGVQGRSVSVDVDIEGTKPSAPATAHVNAIFEGGTGPYTWRRPV